MDFGEWAKNERKKREWDLLTLEKNSSVDNSTIVRIEGAQTQATLLSAIRLWAALDIPFSTLISDLNIVCTIETFPTLAKIKGQLRLTPTDVYNFLKFCLTKENDARSFTTKWLDRFISNLHLFEISLPTGEFTTEDFWSTSFEFPYPKHLTFSDLSHIFENGEALTFFDAGFYMYLLRQKNKVKKAAIERALKISDPVLERIERGVIAKIKLLDVIQINNYLDPAGFFFAYYWAAGMQIVKVKDIIADYSSRREALKLWPAEQAAYNLVTLYRWLRVDTQMLSEFLDDLRNLSP
jgi:transcriptional regulator with XRE-family HTH domain